jgi:hypothetical protein
MSEWIFHVAAREEFDEAMDRYNEARPGLGDAFLDLVNDALEQATLPSPGVTVPGVRRANVRRLLMTPQFPYAVVLLTDARVVIAVAHLRRRPSYWRKRLPRRATARRTQ